MAYSGMFGRNTAPKKPMEMPQAREGRQSSMPGLSGILKKIEAAGMETDDLLMALVLYLMYRESGDRDLLIMLGAMLLS